MLQRRCTGNERESERQTDRDRDRETDKQIDTEHKWLIIIMIII